MFCYSDAVIRTCYYKYFHPKECLITNGVLNRAILEAAGKNIPGLPFKEDSTSGRYVMQIILNCSDI